MLYRLIRKSRNISLLKPSDLERQLQELIRQERKLKFELSSTVTSTTHVIRNPTLIPLEAKHCPLITDSNIVILVFELCDIYYKIGFSANKSLFIDLRGRKMTWGLIRELV